jgi:hypothetical protein
MSLPLNFKIEGFQRWTLLASPWLCAAFMCLSLALPFLPDKKHGNATFMLWFSIVTAIGWGVGAWYSARAVLRLRLTAFTVDEDGLWPTALPRDSSLVRWAEIAAIRERPTLQRLELRSATGTELARLEYQLTGFEQLRAIVLAKSNLAATPTLLGNGTYELPRWHHAFSMGSMVAFSALGWYVGQSQPLLGYLGMTLLVALIGWEYWGLPYRVRTTVRGLEIAFPARTRFISRQLIKSIEMADEFSNNMRRPHVVIQLMGSERPVRLKGFKLPPVELMRALLAWQRSHEVQLN